MVISAQDKIRSVKAVVESKKSISEVAAQFDVSPRSLFRWVRRYQTSPKRLRTSCLVAKYVRGVKHPRAVRPETYGAVRRLIVSHPEWGVRKISAELSRTGFGLGASGVYDQLVGLGANTPDLRKVFVKSWSGPGRVSSEIKLEIVRSVLEEGKGVAEVCRAYKVSRRSLYNWINRYHSKSNYGVSGIAIFDDAYVFGSEHPRAVSPEIEVQLLSLVAAHPDFSVHKLAGQLPVSLWTIQKMLARNHLNLYEQRVRYAAEQRDVEEARPVVSQFVDRVKSMFGAFMPNLAPAPPPVVSLLKKVFSVLAVLVLVFLSINWWSRLAASYTLPQIVGLAFATIALSSGMLFFLYSLKYYFTIALVLSYSQTGAVGIKDKFKGRKGFVAWLLGMGGEEASTQGRSGPVGLEPNLDRVKLTKTPMVCIQIPFYNEKNVAERAVVAACNLDYPNYEVIIADDSTDATTSIIRKYQDKFGKVREEKGEGWSLTTVEVRRGVVLKHLHRMTRSGFKGAALNLALRHTDPKVEFIGVFDADFIPFPDSIRLFLKYFKLQNNMSENYERSNVAVVQGYQWHVLNKSENWITRGVRTEYSGSYVIERAGTELYGGLKMISGSVYMIRKKPLVEAGWGSSITEDFELTLKLYNLGYKVVYTPYIQAPAECVSTLKRLVKQRMRWAEGHSFNIKQMMGKLFASGKLTGAEKFELAYLAPYYLQAFFFIVGTLSWLISEMVFKVKLPFWSVLWGWSLVLTNMLSLPLVNIVGLFYEESERRDYLGIGSFILLCYLVAPFQAYAAVKGFLEDSEGPWFRTPKTGLTTDIFTRGRFYRLVTGLFSGGRSGGIGSLGMSETNMAVSPYLALATANNSFNNFKISPQKHQWRWLSKGVIAILLFVVISIGYLSNLFISLTNDFTVTANEVPLAQQIDPTWFDVPGDYPSVNAELDLPVGGNLGKIQIASLTTKTSLSARDELANEKSVSIEFEQANLGKTIKMGNKVTRGNIYAGVDLEQETYDGYLNQILTLKNDTTEKSIGISVSKDASLILEDYFGHVMVKDKDTQEELFFLRYPQGIDAQNRRIDFKYEIAGDKLRLYPNRPGQLEGAVYPIKIYAPINVVAWSEATVQVGENCPDVACGKDGDANNFRPAGWWWGTDEKRKHVQVKVPKMKEVEREEYNSNTQDRPENNEDGSEVQLTQKQQDRLFSVEGLPRYAIDYTKLADPIELTMIRDKNKNEFSPSLDAKTDKTVIEKKTNLLASIIPEDRRLAYQPEPKAGLLARLFRQIVKPVSADGQTVKTIGSASRDFSCIGGTGCWEATQQGDLTAAGPLHGIQEGDLYNDSTFTLTATQTIDGSTTDASHYMFLTVPASERHNGTATTGVLIDAGNSATCLTLSDNFTRLEWMRIRACGGANGRSGVNLSSATDLLVQKVIIYELGGMTFTATGVRCASSGTASATLRNSIIYTGSPYGIRGVATTCTVTIENTTFWGMSRGIYENTANFTVRNVISMNNTGSDILVVNGTCSYSVCEDNDTDCAAGDVGATCTNSLTNKSATAQFVSTTSGSEDFHLKTGSDAIDVGTTIGAFSDDIDGDTRPINTVWDIGADELPENLWGLFALAPFFAGLAKRFKKQKSKIKIKK